MPAAHPPDTTLETTPSLNAALLQQDPRAAVERFVAERRRWFEGAFAAGADALMLARAHAECLDRAIAVLVGRIEESVGEHPTALFALGGYGRAELGLFSDIDLLFLHDGAHPDAIRELTDGVLYPLWDCGVEAGGATRTIADCRTIIEEDVRALTAMMEARRLGGAPAVAKQLHAFVGEHFASMRARRRFIETKLEERRARLARYGDSIYILQPHLKEGEGGLRDYQTLIWVASAWWPKETPPEALARAIGARTLQQRLEASVSFLWRVRHALHLFAGKRADRLGEAEQPEIARMLGFEAVGAASPSEALMAEYYEHAEGIHRLCDRALERIRREAFPPSRWQRLLRRRTIGTAFVRTEANTIAFRPGEEVTELSSLRLFAVAKRRCLSVDAEALDAVAAALHRDVQQPPWTEEAAAIWRDILATPGGLGRTLEEMRACGLLERFIPEMIPMIHRVQHDGFHVYTAGVHSLKAVAELDRLARRAGRDEDPGAARILRGLPRPHVLILATLLHDVGKGRDADHAEVGATLAKAIARRMGWSARDIADVAFLVRQHLLMGFVAFRRDIGDAALVERFAQVVRSTEMLGMLALLTRADMCAVGPNIWSDWKDGLLAELYAKARSCLEEGGMTPERRRQQVERRLRAAAQIVADAEGPGAIEEFVAGLPERYLLTHPPETIAAHAMMARQLGERAVITAWRTVPERGVTELSLVTRDRPGLFAIIAGVLSANGANVVDAQVATSAAGEAIDLFWVTDAENRPLDDPARLERMRREMDDVIAGRRPLEAVLGGRLRDRLLSAPARRRGAIVTVDNDVSAEETVVEIQADDRRGLLFAIASRLHELGTAIDRARITTHVDRVIDVFYIRDATGRKIDAKERLEAIQQGLREALEE